MWILFRICGYIIKGVLVFCLAIGFVVGGFVGIILLSRRDTSPVITEQMKTLSYNNIPVYFETKRKITQDLFNEIFDSQPQVLLNNCQAIYVCDGTGDNTCTDTYGNDEVETFADYAGFATGDGSQRIFINASDIGNHMVENYELSAETVTHELGHQFDFANHISDSDTWQQIYQQDSKVLGDYASTDVREFFAEACAEYFNDPDSLQEDSQTIYNAMQDIFHAYQ